MYFLNMDICFSRCFLAQPGRTPLDLWLLFFVIFLHNCLIEGFKRENIWDDAFWMLWYTSEKQMYYIVMVSCYKTSAWKTNEKQKETIMIFPKCVCILIVNMRHPMFPQIPWAGKPSNTLAPHPLHHHAAQSQYHSNQLWNASNQLLFHYAIYLSSI